MVTVKNAAQIAKMRAAGELLWQVLEKVSAEVRPGVNTLDLDAYAHELIVGAGAVPSFLGFEGYPATLCTSVDDQVVHGIPSKDQVLREGSIISLDCGLKLEGWQSDSARTIRVGEVPPEIDALIRVTEECFFIGARMAVSGNTLGDIGAAIQAHAESHGYGVIRDLTGHGIGREMHEDPAVYNIGLAGHGMRLQPGMTLAIEPMIALGDWRGYEDDDGWCFRTRDGKPCSHYEQTLVVRESGLPEILSYPGFEWKER